MRKFFLAGLIGIITIAFVGCSGDKNSNITEKNQANNDINISKDKKDYVEKPELEAKPTDKVESGNKVESNIDKPDKTERIFKIVTKNVDYEVISQGEIKTVGLSVADNIKKILSTISNKYFDGKTLELKTIETVNNKKIAVINLGGDKSYWHQRMQGSAGGEITEYTLIENILQRDYKGYWIDGVKFTLDGKKVEGTQHSSDLAKTIYR
ncbi:MAG: hypothetical protein ACREV6_01280 [Clostridium sp.]|uniref:hypothetical protein n=1 Tax=Clostridium sp. TaxID=1506 RepID=UPI003D6CDBB8